MTAPFARRLALAVATLVAALALAACGGGDSSSSGSGEKAASRPPTRPRTRRPSASSSSRRSGPTRRRARRKVNATIDIDVTGVPALEGPDRDLARRRLRARRRRRTCPDFKLEAGLLLRDQAYGGALLLNDGKAYIQVGTTGYLQSAGDRDEDRGAGAEVRQRHDEDRGDVLHQPELVAQEHEDRRRRRHRRRADDARDRRHPRRPLLPRHGASSSTC